MDDAKKRFAGKLRRLAENLDAELASMPNEIDFPAKPLPWDPKTRSEAAHRAKANHVTRRLISIGDLLGEMVAAGKLGDPLANDVVHSVDNFIAESEARGNVPNKRGYIIFRYFLKDWLPHRSDEFDYELDGKAGLGNLLFPTLMIRNIRTLASAIGGVEASPPSVPVIDDSLWPTVTKAAREQAVGKDVISKAASSGKLKTNGKGGHARRIDPASLIEWSLSRVAGQ